MAIKDTLLKEAIADAKAVRETAIANAMMSLKDSFKPQLTNMLTAKLREESNVDEQTKLDSSGIGTGITVDDPGPKEPTKAARSSSDIENPGQEVDPMGEGVVEGEFDADHDDLDHPGDDEDELNPAGTGGDEELDGQPNDEFGNEHDFDHDDQNDDDLDLEAIIRELEAEAGMHDESEEMGGTNPLKDEDWQTANAGKFSGRDVDLDEAEAKRAEEASDEKYADGKVSLGTEGKQVTKEEIAKPPKESSDDEYADGKVRTGVDEDINLEEILREIEAEEESASTSNIASENVALKRSLREHREVIKLLRTRINEVNLLNSKLLYTTKLFRNFQLTEAIKREIIEQFDRAKNLREAKITYSVLAQTYKKLNESKPARSVAKKLTESASTTVGTTKPKTAAVINEGDAQVARFKKLAGIKPING